MSPPTNTATKGLGKLLKISENCFFCCSNIPSEICDGAPFILIIFGHGSYGMDAKMVLEWAIKSKSRVINQERMFDNVFD